MTSEEKAELLQSDITTLGEAIGLAVDAMRSSERTDESFHENRVAQAALLDAVTRAVDKHSELVAKHGRTMAFA